MNWGMTPASYNKGHRISREGLPTGFVASIYTTAERGLFAWQVDRFYQPGAADVTAHSTAKHLQASTEWSAARIRSCRQCGQSLPRPI